MGSGKTRNVGGDSKTKKRNKLRTRKMFEARHVDQVWEDMRKLPAEVHQAGAVGPLGTTSKAQLDEDTPGYGKHYCIPCSRYFQSAEALVDHNKTKPHKRKLKMLVTSARPHNQTDAEVAAGMGRPDDGPRLRSEGAVAMVS